jgi:hypothetical protein
MAVKIDQPDNSMQKPLARMLVLARAHGNRARHTVRSARPPDAALSGRPRPRSRRKQAGNRGSSDFDQVFCIEVDHIIKKGGRFRTDVLFSTII